MQIIGETGSQYEQILSACFIISGSFAVLSTILDNHWRESISITIVKTSNEVCQERAVVDHRSGPAEREEGERNKRDDGKNVPLLRLCMTYVI
jgi:hypothetical protein